MNWDHLKREEERKRDAASDPAQRWIHIQQTITWAEANLPPHLRRNRPRQPRRTSFDRSTLESKGRSIAPTLADKLGDVAQVSGLAIRLAQASRAGGRLPDWLLKVAVERGAKHYQRPFDSTLPPDNPTITDEEIGVALCLGQHPYNLDHLRAAAQLLSSPRVSPKRLGWLAVLERCEPVMLHIAEVAARFGPDLEPWSYLRGHLAPRPVPRTDALPHWSRLVSHTGVTAFGGPPRIDWLARSE
ncbi:MAG: hypothetical protein FJ403_10330 [Verrucomicrobia bacterium]|nr:hypothetical protein [Verrucomicrobiota bacterium]